ncbi:MAG TPA: restriction endonuclease subunit S, partial [Aggregatilineales bacterium]|nr:restriction endonuclease subunit S [Aggregatilineales bacterium]
VGDILFTREAPAGEVCVVPDGLDLCLGQRVVLFRVNKSLLNPDFAVNSIYYGIASRFIELLSQGSTVAHFNMFDIGDIPILLPPLEEQNNVVDYLQNEILEISYVLNQSYDQIDRIREYRTRLIADVVTGKMDVRGAVFEMPVEVDETDLPDVAEDELFDEDDDLLDDLGEINHDENGHERIRTRGTYPTSDERGWVAGWSTE